MGEGEDELDDRVADLARICQGQQTLRNRKCCVSLREDLVMHRIAGRGKFDVSICTSLGFHLRRTAQSQGVS
jgi:hypothetical protein